MADIQECEANSDSTADDQQKREIKVILMPGCVYLQVMVNDFLTGAR